VILALAAAGAAHSATVAPLPQRDGVAVAWQPGPRTALISTRDGRTYVVHGLRKTRPGTRVRIQGIKWGKPTAGIKWSARPRGIKWGIKWARNGTYQSRARVMGRTTTVNLRGTMVRRVGNARMTVAVPGATVTLPLAPTAAAALDRTRTSAKKRTMAARTRIDGRRVSLTLHVNARGVVRVTAVRPVTAPAASVPVSGRIVAIDRTTRQITVRGDGAGAPALTLAVPAGADLGRLRIGMQVTGMTTRDPQTGELTVATLGLNGSFSAADTLVIQTTTDAQPGSAASGASPVPPPATTPVPTTPVRSAASSVPTGGDGAAGIVAGTAGAAGAGSPSAPTTGDAAAGDGSTPADQPDGGTTGDPATGGGATGGTQDGTSGGVTGGTTGDATNGGTQPDGGAAGGTDTGGGTTGGTTGGTENGGGTSDGTGTGTGGDAAGDENTGGDTTGDQTGDATGGNSGQGSPTSSVAIVSTTWQSGLDSQVFTGTEGMALAELGTTSLAIINDRIRQRDWSAALDEIVRLRSTVAGAGSDVIADPVYADALRRQLTDLQVTVATRQSRG